MIWVILIITLGLRLIGISQSLWLDEAISINVAKLPIGQIISDFSVSDFHPPGYYWFLNLWIRIFGDTVPMMRLSSVLFSVITVFEIYKIGEILKNKKTGLWAAWFAAINPLMIYYGQELRMYAMMTMWLTGAVYYWIKLVTDKKGKYDWLWFGVLTFMAFVSFYGSVFLTGAMILYFLIKKDLKNFGKSILGISLALLIVSPLLVSQLKMANTALDEVINWSLVLGKVNLKNLLLIPIKFSIGRLSWYPKEGYYLVSGGWTILVWYIGWRNGRKRKELLWLMIIPLILGIVFSIKSPMIQYFRFLYLVPILALWLAEVKNKWVKIVLSVGFLGFSGVGLLNPAMHREDWKSVTSYMPENSVVYMVKTFEDPIKFYNPKIKISDIRSEISEENIWVVPYGEVIHGVNHEEILEKKQYKIKKKINFREMVLEEWEKY